MPDREHTKSEFPEETRFRKKFHPLRGDGFRIQKPEIQHDWGRTPPEPVVEESEPTPTPVPGWNPGDTFNEASGVIVNITQNTIDFLIWVVIVLLPITITITGVIWAVRWTLKKLEFKEIPRTPNKQEKE